MDVQSSTDYSVLIDSVFDASFACFDESINLYQWIKPWKSYVTVDTMQKNELVCNSTYTSDLLYYTNRYYRVLC